MLSRMAYSKDLWGMDAGYDAPEGAFGEEMQEFGRKQWLL
jgi:hypothetical protein